MKKFYQEAPMLTVTVFENADVVTVSYQDDNVGGWNSGWLTGNGGGSNNA